jgi:uncharacterized protein YyaL (SSP411 family)
MTAESTMTPNLPSRNKLAAESSPYLAQHADNPVAWQPWGDEAFETARLCDVPVFLSIGYSTCHWCHVMAHESFEDEHIARLLNENFVCIKVDREERPDIDAVYMRFCQILTGSGGWPLTIVMTPDKKPFFAATYIPPQSRAGRQGMVELLPRIADAWQRRRNDILHSTQQIMDAVTPEPIQPSIQHPDTGLTDRAFENLKTTYDRKNGGFGNAPKFPTPHTILFLLRYWKRTRSAEALDMAVETLRAIRRGGIYDHVGFGFHRYSTDPFWFLPHFEKMLYDQALLLWAYAEAYQATGNREFADTAREIAAFVLRDLKAPEGGFYSAFDADSEEGEGAFYQWRYSELEALLDPGERALAEDLCGACKEGNVHDEATGRATGANIIRLNESLAAYALNNGFTEQEIASRFKTLRQKLFNARAGRTPPGLDEKILTDWNALMIGALALAGRVLGDENFIAEAQEAADWILQTLYRQGEGLLHRYCKGQSGICAHIDDYSFMIWGLMELYQACFKEQYLLWALRFQKELDENFTDEQSGAFFSTHAATDDLPLRPLEIYDGALPSGNSIAMLNLLRLGSLTGDTSYNERARKIAAAFCAQIERMPNAFCMLMCALEFEAGPRTTIALTGRHGAPDTLELQSIINRLYLPDAIAVFHADGTISAELSGHLPDTVPRYPSSEKAAAHVCRNNTCLPPAHTAADLKKILLTGTQR